MNYHEVQASGKTIFVEGTVCGKIGLLLGFTEYSKVPSSFLDCEAEESPGEMTDSFLALSELGHLDGSK